MSTEENKAIVRRFWEEFNKKNLAVVDELYAANFVFHRAGMEDIRGSEGLKQYLATALTAFPDFHYTVEDMVAEGDKVVVRLTGTGTHQGEFQGIAPTGKQVTLTATQVHRLVGGKFVETWAVADMLGLMQQLGAIPTPGQG